MGKIKMIVAKAPLRVSLFGGGTDFKDFFDEHQGFVIGCSINKFVYVGLLPLVEESQERYRLTYRITESVQTISEFQHPAFKAILETYEWDTPINVSTMSNVPGGSGLGSSSAFCVATLAALSKLRGLEIDPYRVAMQAVGIERGILKEYGGWQDQFHSSFGGFRAYKFQKDHVEVGEPLFNQSQLSFLSDCLFLVFVGKVRSGLQRDMNSTGKPHYSKPNELLIQLAAQAQRVSSLEWSSYSNDRILEIISKELKASWQLKREILGPEVPGEAENVIKEGLEKGALAAKLCGGGGGGYVLFVVDPKEKNKIIMEIIRSGKIVRDISLIPHGFSVVET